MHLEKIVLVLSVVIACVLSSKFLDQEWKAWKAKHGKEYSDSHDEMFRRKAWEATWYKVQKHNQLADQGLSRYRMAMNKYADLTPEERTSKNCFNLNTKTSSQNHVPVRDYSRTLETPESVDWRDKKCVSPVKNQGYCGSCWAFATVGVFETLNCIKTKQLVQFSEQQLVDCDNRSGNDGCCGGLPLNAMAYVARRGIMPAKDYEYLDKQAACLYRPDNSVTFNVTNYYIVPGEDNMANSLAFNGPLAVGIDASDDFSLYRSGIFDDECTAEPNHAVIIVGYGTEHDELSDKDMDYWIVRNSWGEDWGDNGYIKMRRNVNLCGIATFASAAELAR